MLSVGTGMDDLRIEMLLDASVDQNIFSKSVELKLRRTSRKSNNILVSRNANESLAREARENTVRNYWATK